MPGAEVGWSAAARADLLAAVEYLVDKAPAAAARLVEDADAVAGSLSRFPERGGLIYRLRGGSVQIVRFLHGRRDLEDAWRSAPPGV